MTPEARWLDTLEKKIGWFSLPNLALFLSALQGFGFLAYIVNPNILMRISLNPEAVMAGEIWRVITFLAIPIDNSPIFMIVAVWFLYFSVNALEQQWGEFKTTIYIFISLLITVIYSLTTGLEIASFRYIEMSILFALATLFPDFEILLFFILPVKMKFIGLFSAAIVVYEFLVSPGIYKFYILLVYTNYFVFFGGFLINMVIQLYRRWNYKRKMKD